MQQLNNLKSKSSAYSSLERKYSDLETLMELCADSDEEELKQELHCEMGNFKRFLDKIKLDTLLVGKHDSKMPSSLHAGGRD